MLRGGGAVIGNVPAHFETTGDLLRMIAFNPAASGEIGRTAENQIELLLRINRYGFAEIAVTYLIAFLNAIPASGFSSKPDALFLRFDRHQLCSG